MAKKELTAWDKLSMSEKALFMKLGLLYGITDLKDIRDTYNLYANGGNLAHKKSGEELGESQDLNSNWLPQFAYTPSATQSQILNVLGITPMTALELYTAQEVVKEIDNPGYTQMKQNAKKTQMLKDMHVVEQNPGLTTMGEIPLLNTVASFMPVLGDVMQGAEAIVAAKQGDYLTAGLLGGMMFMPNFIEKPLKKWKNARNLTKELKERPLLQIVDNEEINAWLSENWYKNEVHNVRPILKSRTVSIDDFDKYGIPLHYKLEDDFPTFKKGNDNVLIHVDNRLPLLAGRRGFLPLDGYTGDSPAIWWQRDYPYYTEPSSLSFLGHTLKVKEGDVIPLEPLRRYPNAPGPVVVTEGALPYDILEGYKWNSDLSWFERERFMPSKSKLDYFKHAYLPAWYTYSTGGPLYPFSFEKNPFLKTPIVRY